MAGIGVKLNKIYEKSTITTDLYGFIYSTVITIAPMLLVFAAIMLMQFWLGFSRVSYAARELYSCTVLYIFIFAFLVVSPFNPVISRFMSDMIYEEKYEDILACFYAGLFMTVVLGCILGIPFCLHEHFVGEVPVYYVFTGFCGYISLIMVIYCMTYLSISKDYKRVSFFFLIGMALTIVSSLIFCFIFYMEPTYSALLGLVLGFFVIAVLEYGQVRQFFPVNSGKYGMMLRYFRKYWQLIFINFLYVLGLYTHNFVFWTTELRIVVVKSFVCAEPYDVATCIAMFTNIAASVIFISRVEMRFRERYKAYTEAVIGGRWMDIETSKKRMFRHLSDELVGLVRIQFIVSVVIYFLAILFLPRFGYGGLVMEFYHCLAAGYFPLFIMYAAILFLYYFNDLVGALFTSILFFVTVLAGSIIGTHLPYLWGGIGVFAGSMVGFVVAYFRLRWLERRLDFHVFCDGRILKTTVGKMPSGKVLDRYNGVDETEIKKKVQTEATGLEVPV